MDVCLPPLITRPEQVWCFNWPSVKPNSPYYPASRGSPSGGTRNGGSIENTIVCIPNVQIRDLIGFFSHKIKGLITAWGGVNSHMAIRAGETNLPAVIGAGEALYKKWASSNISKNRLLLRKVKLLDEKNIGNSARGGIARTGMNGEIH